MDFKNIYKTFQQTVFNNISEAIKYFKYESY
jgi:hypothetical protein